MQRHKKELNKIILGQRAVFGRIAAAKLAPHLGGFEFYSLYKHFPVQGTKVCFPVLTLPNVAEITPLLCVSFSGRVCRGPFVRCISQKCTVSSNALV
jgi:hypothetical protein